jgi:hypothetical protein
MPADWLFSLLRNPITIGAWLSVVIIASVARYRAASFPPPIAVPRLIVGYAVALAICVVFSGASAYVSKEEAAAIWHVQPERYREVLTREFLNNLAGATFVAGLGIALVGVPTICWLARKGRAQIGWVLVASACISGAFSIAFAVLFLSSSSVWLSALLQLFGYCLLSHLVLSLGFSLGAGLRWRASNAEA